MASSHLNYFKSSLAGLLLWVGLAPSTGVAAETDSGVQWLIEMRTAAVSRDYQGNVSYLKDQQVDSFRLYHKVVDGQEFERLISVNSPLREVVRAGTNVSRYSSDSRQVFVDTKPSSHSVLINLPEDPATLERFYRINLRGQEYVAGQMTQVVALEPRDGFRYTRLLWIDTQTHLPLKFDVLNEEGQSVEQMVFTSINTKDTVLEKDLEPSSHPGASITQISHRETQPLEAFKWTLKQVPEGFQIVSYSVFERPTTGQTVEQLLLSDGFSSVSVYIEEQGASAASGTRRIGAVNVATETRKGHLVTVMGEVPVKTVQLIAKGLEEKVRSQP